VYQEDLVAEQGSEAPSTEDAKQTLRPHVYYNDGPFDAPSSESEDETLLEKNGRVSPGTAERGFAVSELPFSAPKVRDL
jgi:dipeptidyl aminopeptidase B